MQYRVSRRAKADIEAVFREGIVRWGMFRADAYYDDLFDAFSEIVEFPLACRERPDVGAGLHVKVYRSHGIIYELNDGAPTILRVVHGHYDWQNDL